MACDSRKVDGWFRVPDGSELEVSVLGASEDDTDFVGSADVICDEGHGEHTVSWTDGDLNPGPATLALKGGCNYSVDIDVLFSGDDVKVQIRARIVKPNGDQHGGAYCREICGDNGDEEGSDLFVFTRR